MGNVVQGTKFKRKPSLALVLCKDRDLMDAKQLCTSMDETGWLSILDNTSDSQPLSLKLTTENIHDVAVMVKKVVIFLTNGLDHRMIMLTYSLMKCSDVRSKVTIYFSDSQCKETRENRNRLIRSVTHGLKSQRIVSSLIAKLTLSAFQWKSGIDICVNTHYDVYPSWISSCCLIAPGKFLLVDNGNSCVKVLDAFDNCIAFQLPFVERPVVACAFFQGQVAVTVPVSNSIFILCLKKYKLYRTHQIHTSHRYHSIAFNPDCLYGLYNDSDKCIKVNVLNPQGELLQTITTTINIRDAAIPLMFVTVSTSDTLKPCMFVSYSLTDTILRISLDGTKVNEYRHSSLSQTTGTTDVGYGRILVCSSGNNSIVLLSGKNACQTILSEDDGIRHPRTIAYCPESGKMIVGTDQNVRLFNVMN
ncbi:uncharacterized protein LOC128223155 isoform X2 [Mya arenaria]|uniref:uncharacterized protein LOC128223155 isoform X2 n=1 Tax=Mya arenaria TaxID=6604 RepID=UPI0022E63156|nr:uncharacterized protein LOC128223155 isoform X2 [Mya arenaria]